MSSDPTVYVKKMLKHLAKSKCSDELDAHYFSEILNAYFVLGRPSHFIQFKEEILKTYLKILEHLPIELSFKITHQLFLYVRTNNSVNGDLENQSEINKRVLQPFQTNLERMLPSIEVPRLDFNPNKDVYVVMTRHAVTQGMYAPGKQIYSVCDALLKAQKKVILVNFGSQDEKFLELEKHPRFFLYNCRNDFNSLQSFFELRELIGEIKPTEIITEIELSALNLIEAIGVSSEVCLFSAGFFQTPWFDKKYIASDLYSEDMNTRAGFVEIPQTLSLEILAPSVPVGEVERLRMELSLQDKFVFGSFARYEMFTEEFLEFAKRALCSVPDSVLILAGTNDQTVAQSYLAEEIEQKRVILFGPIKTYVFGWLIDVFLDPFPTVAGFAALESLAKGKPVVTKECAGLGNYRKSRVQDLIFEKENDLLDTLTSMADCKNMYCRWSEMSKELAASFDRSKALADAICQSPSLQGSSTQSVNYAL